MTNEAAKPRDEWDLVELP
ncbi:protein of unknown function [Blastococcus saxobsidens DD2]|uniref:Uncharacterized protein n=1 Tax=Blastococcus saxobsidens (strain DD2) TaxID=1146883 RepID=H6RKF1_BLASD|nr:protein of unknown function [Blastococcus saxobsidens DD2]